MQLGLSGEQPKLLFWPLYPPTRLATAILDSYTNFKN